MEKSGFFNAMKVGDTWDRAYKAENFAEYFASFIANGVFPNPATGLQVVETDKMNVILKEGKGWINGFIYINTDDLILPVDVADGVLDRIDRIVLRYGLAEREIKATVKKGDFSSSPVAPTLQRDADAYELGIADIYVKAGAISISQANITDLRLNNTYCGIVHGTVDQVDTTTLFNQYQSWFQKKMQQCNSDLENFIENKKQAFTTWYDTTTVTSEEDIATMKQNFENDFNTWFNTIKNILDGDATGNLLNMINSLGGEGRTTETVKKNADDIKSLGSQMADMATKEELKSTQDKADSAYNLANGKQDKLTISSSTSSTSTTQVASSSAVKQAMDKANSAFQLGDSTRKDTVSILSSKGIEGLTESSTWGDIKDSILNMTLGKPLARGSQSFSHYIEEPVNVKVSNLLFKPKIVILLVRYDWQGYIGEIAINIDNNSGYFNSSYSPNGSKYMVKSSSGDVYNATINITNNGFDCAYRGTSDTSDTIVYWIAIG